MNVSTAIKWNITIATLLGLSQLTKRTVYEVVKWRNCWSIFLFLLLGCIPVINLNKIGFWDLDNVRDLIRGTSWYITCPGLMMISILSNLMNQKKLRILLNKLEKLSESVHKLTESSSTVPFKVFFVKLLLYLFFIFCCDFKFFINSKFKASFEYFVLTCTSLMMSYYSIYITIISTLLKDLNMGLKAFLKISDKQTLAFCGKLPFELESKKGKPLGKICSGKMTESIKQYRMAYHEIYKISKKLTHIFATIIIAMTATLALFTIVEFYLLWIKFSPSGYQMMMLSWCFMGLVLLVLFIEPCNQLSTGGEKLAGIINGYIALSDSRADETKEMVNFSIILMQEPISFVPHNMLNFNKELIITIFGMAVSYVVILSQVSE